MANIFAAAAFVSAVQALAFDGVPPKPTHTVIADATFHLPETTQPPSLRELAKRQNGQTVLVGPDNTCGYFDGRAGAVYSCNGLDVTCAFVTTSTIGAVACCSGGDCGLRVACLDYRDINLSSSCDNGCFADTYTVKCTNLAAPYCGTATFFDGIMDYFCDTLSYSTPQQLYTTYDGEDDGRTFTAVVVTLSDDTSPSSDSPSSSSPPSNNGGSSNSSGSSSSSPNVGAIVGGVVGGVAGIALIALGIFFLVRHNKKKKNNIPSAQQPEVQQNPGPNGPTPGMAAAGYAQPPYNNSSPYNQQPAYGTPPQQQMPPQGYFTPDQKPAGFVAMAPTSQPDRNDSTSPVSQFTDPNRQSSQQYPYQPTSPTSTVNSSVNTWQQQQQQQQHQTVPPTVHEAGGNAVGDRDYNSNHHGQFHELGS
ncbi:hypothetical protein F5X99DRAFT_43569 [Biscogniauxia marginata]|nr:hypothetical protein F5X99DRAFT_43569 [Biscogniauxia marginata]